MASFSDGSPTWARNVRLLTVRDDGEEIVVDIYGGDRGVVGTILYRPESPDRHRDTIATLQFWKERGTPLTYLCRDGVASLRDEEAAFRAAHGADAD